MEADNAKQELELRALQAAQLATTQREQLAIVSSLKQTHKAEITSADSAAQHLAVAVEATLSVITAVTVVPDLEVSKPISTNNMRAPLKKKDEAPSADRTQSAMKRSILEKLSELEGRVVAGGTQAGNESLKENLETKGKLAKEKDLRRRHALAGGDDDQMVEIYSSMQGIICSFHSSLTIYEN